MIKKAKMGRSKRDNCCCCNDESDDEFEDVCVVGNEIFFYTDVTEETVMWLNKTIRKLERDLVSKGSEIGGIVKPEVKLYINSHGGDMFSGMSAMDHISNSRLRITTIADGMCASAATFMLLGGHKRMMKPHAHVLIHQLSTNGFWGKFEDLKDEMKSCKKFMEMIRSIYEQNCKIPEDRMESMMKKDIYLDAAECLEFNIVEEVVGGVVPKMYKKPKEEKKSKEDKKSKKSKKSDDSDSEDEDYEPKKKREKGQNKSKKRRYSEDSDDE